MRAQCVCLFVRRHGAMLEQRMGGAAHVHWGHSAGRAWATLHSSGDGPKCWHAERDPGSRSQPIHLRSANCASHQVRPSVVQRPLWRNGGLGPAPFAIRFAHQVHSWSRQLCRFFALHYALLRATIRSTCVSLLRCAASRPLVAYLRPWRG